MISSRGLAITAAFLGAALLPLGACVGDDPASSASVDSGLDGAPAETAGCTSTCATEGATQCDKGHVQTCRAGGDGCLRWSDQATCPTDQICCASACAPVDTSNCYACGAACSGATPRCLPAPKKCGCSVAVCAATSQGCSPQTGACEACSALAAGATDIYVDATGFAGATGTEACPVKTITAALTKANASAANAITIHVAAGTYDVAHGETFPLTLRSKTITIVGEGADKTTIQGNGALDHSARGGQLNGSSYQATIVVGDEVATHGISKVTVRAASDTPANGVYGIFCDLGNTPPTITNPPVGFPPASLALDAVTVGPGFDRGVIVSTTTISSIKKGCNLSATRSSFTDSFNGIWAVGAGLSNEPGTTVGLSVSQGTFNRIRNPNNNDGRAIDAWDGASRVLLHDNTVDDSNVGFALVNHARADVNIPVAPYYEIEKNKVTGATNYGVGIFQSMIVEKLNDNTITGATVDPGLGYQGVGIVIDPSNANGAYLPIIKKARGNTIVGNDVGIALRGKAFQTQPDGLKTDFGTGADPGKNVIACNSRRAAGSALIGYDLLVGAQSLGSGEPTFAGNAWDHAPVAPVTAASSTNGTDLLYTQTSSTPNLDLSGAAVRSMACPAGRTP